MQNVGGIGFIANKRSRETLKMEKIKKIVCQNSVDVLALTEVNKDWRKVDSKNTIWEGIKGWREFHRVQVAYNTTSPSDKDYQVGGTLMCAFNDFSPRISEQSFDYRRLGQWSL